MGAEVFRRREKEGGRGVSIAICAHCLGFYLSPSLEGRVWDALFDAEDMMTGTDGERGAMSADWAHGALCRIIRRPFGCREGAVGEGRRGGPRQDPG
jgi:hypothetical protein